MRAKNTSGSVVDLRGGPVIRRRSHCGHEWVARSNTPPKKCHKCQTLYVGAGVDAAIVAIDQAHPPNPQQTRVLRKVYDVIRDERKTESARMLEAVLDVIRRGY